VSLVLVGSVRGAPGVTTTSLLLAGCLNGAVLAEADLAGGVLAVRYQLGREPGLTTLAAAGPIEPDGWRDHAQSAGGVTVLVGPDAPETSESMWQRAGGHLGAVLTGVDAPIVIDAGRLSDRTPLVGAAALVVVVVRPIAEHLVALAHRLNALRQTTPPGAVAVVLVGEGPYRAVDVSGPLEVEVLGTLPEDHRAAEVLRGGGRSSALRRSRLARAAIPLTAAITGRLDGIGVPPAGARV
jgi:hypothetical protein